MKFSLREEDTTTYISFYQGYLEEVQQINRKVTDELNEVMRESKYDKLQQRISEIIDAYMETVVGDIDNGLFSNWVESKGSLRACLRTYRAGEAADEVCAQVEQSMGDLMQDILKIEKADVIITERPIVSEDGLERLEDVCRNAQTEIQNIKSGYIAQVDSKSDENEIYGTLRPLFEGVVANLESFFEASLISFTELHEFVSGISVSKTTNSSKNTQNIEEKSEEKKRDTIKKAAQKAKSVAINLLLKELDTPEKIKDYKKYIEGCQSKFNECKAEENKETQKSKFKQFGDFVKEGAKKYTKPIAKTLGIIVPLIASESSLAAKIAKALPSVMECFSGVLDENKDMDKVELGLDCIKSMGVQSFPDDPEKIGEYIEERSADIADDILKKILSSEKYLKVLDIDESELSKPQNREIYKKYTGKELAKVPQKKKVYDYDFEQYEPERLNQLQPRVSEEKVNELSGDIKSDLTHRFNSKDFEQGMNELQALKKELDSSKAYVDITPDSEIKHIIDEIRSIIKAKTQDEYLEDYDGRFNKEELRPLFEEFEAEREKSARNKQQPNYSNACANFLRRHMGYPAQEEEIVVVKSMQELIPVINAQCPRFRVDDESLLTTINAAYNLSTQKNSKIKKKGILKMLWDNATIFGGILGISTLLAMAGCWPLGLLYAWGAIGCVLEDSESTAYANLVYQLGDKRTDCLLENYHNVEKNVFELEKQ